jgi:Xaa-Pro dipeptidase
MLEKKLYRSRIEKVQLYLNNNNADFALITPSPNFQYLTGIETEMRERLVALLVYPEAEPKIIAPAFEFDNLSRNSWISDFSIWEEDEDPYILLKNCVSSKGSRFEVAFDDTLPLGIFWEIEQRLGSMNVLPISSIVHEMRLKKSEPELDLMRKAGKIIELAVTKAFEGASLGITEIELKQIVNNTIIDAGASPTFAAVQFGENSALPHYGGGNRKLEKHDIVLMDCGCSLNGYNTDMTRVGVAGEPTEEQENVYSIVLKSQKVALDQIKPNVSCGTADGFARRIIDNEGYGKFFTHRLGHGIGLEVHEPPYLVRGNAQLLEQGMTHSVEPGIYLEGLFGIRIEDLVAITEDELEVITYMSRDLYEIGI